MGNAHTCQEHKLMGSTVNEEIYKRNPYKPLGVADGSMSIDSANKIRRMMGRCAALGCFFGVESRVTMSLEPLDEQGNTIRDPILLDRNQDYAPLPTQYSDNFPYRRR